LPPPYFDGPADDVKTRRTNGVVFVGPSSTELTPMDIRLSRSEDASSRVHASQDFDLTCVATRSGFHTVGGLRILVMEDRLINPDDEAAAAEGKQTQQQTRLRRATTLKEIEVIGEVWVSP